MSYIHIANYSILFETIELFEIFYLKNHLNAIETLAKVWKRKLANANLNVFDNEAHVSVLYNQIEEIIDESTAHQKISQSR